MLTPYTHESESFTYFQIYVKRRAKNKQTKKNEDLGYQVVAPIMYKTIIYNCTANGHMYQETKQKQELTSLYSYSFILVLVHSLTWFAQQKK